MKRRWRVCVCVWNLTGISSARATRSAASVSINYVGLFSRRIKGHLGDFLRQASRWLGAGGIFTREAGVTAVWWWPVYSMSDRNTYIIKQQCKNKMFSSSLASQHPPESCSLHAWVSTFLLQCHAEVTTLIIHHRQNITGSLCFRWIHKNFITYLFFLCSDLY